MSKLEVSGSWSCDVALSVISHVPTIRISIKRPPYALPGGDDSIELSHEEVAAMVDILRGPVGLLLKRKSDWLDDT